MNRRNRLLNPLARQAMNNFKLEVANELGLINKIKKEPGEMTTREAGKIGGTMVKKMIQAAEEDMSSNPF
ncbi:MAG: small, acid-soluble spore protein, alpha/beta type [Halanaerobiaceae bacterium]